MLLLDGITEGSSASSLPHHSKRASLHIVRETVVAQVSSKEIIILS